MKYSVEFSAEAERDISQLDKAVAQRLLNRIKWLTENIDHTRLEALQGKRWKGLFKLRVGDFEFSLP